MAPSRAKGKRMTTDVRVDVRAAIEKNSYLTSVADLERRGKRQVKVIKTSLIYDLIHQAVENVQRGRETGMGEEERQRLVEESKKEFDRLLSEQQRQRQELADLQEANLDAERLVNDLNRQLAEQNERLRAEAERVRALEEENARLQAAGAEAEGADSGRMQKATDKIHGLEEALKVARQAAQENERKLHDQIDQLKNQEASRDESAGQLHEIIRRREAELEAAKAAAGQTEEYRMQIAGLTAELKAVRENQPATDSLLNELREMREDLKSLESRNRELEAIAAAAPPAAATAGAGTAGIEELLEKKMAQISSELSAKLASLKHGTDVGTSPEDIKLTIQRIFTDELDGKVVSNIGEIKVKERKAGGIAANLERLKNLGKKTDQE
jgi:chromosome segregation ATPase